MQGYEAIKGEPTEKVCQQSCGAIIQWKCVDIVKGICVHM